MLRYTPAVFAVEKNYQIMVPVTGHSLFRVKVGEQYFYDEQNGIMRSICTTHRVNVPAELLDREKKYTVCERELIDRKPYFPLTEDEVEIEFEFKPIPHKNIKIYHVADAHNLVDEPIAASKKFGIIDLLIMNGDIPNHSGEITYFDTIYEIAEKITHGNIPIIFSRGNHDMRGYHAEEIAEYTPNSNGNTYYSVRVGNIWALVLDCGEDKDDSYPSYGYTNASHVFRQRQTEFINKIIENADTEYNEKDVKHKLIICHNPFTIQIGGDFTIEEDIYSEWACLIRENIKPELMLCGHLHRLAIYPTGGEMDHLGQPCLLVVGSDVGEDFHAGCGIVLDIETQPKIEFYNSKDE